MSKRFPQSPGPKQMAYQGTTVGHLYLTAFSTGHGKEPKPKSNEAEAWVKFEASITFFHPGWERSSHLIKYS